MSLRPNFRDLNGVPGSVIVSTNVLSGLLLKVKTPLRMADVIMRLKTPFDGVFSLKVTRIVDVVVMAAQYCLYTVYEYGVCVVYEYGTL
jgi:hypothetical protein